MNQPYPQEPAAPRNHRTSAQVFTSNVVDRIRAAGNIWTLPDGELLLPEVFGFCRGVKRALAMLQSVLGDLENSGKKVFLLGEIIHNPWVNDFFRKRGVQVLTSAEIADLDRHVTHDDCAVIPAFGVSLDIERRLSAIGCRTVDTSCGDVRRLWRWAKGAVTKRYAILIFGRPRHDETVVTKSRLADAGGNYLVVESLDKARQFCRFVTGDAPDDTFTDCFGDDTTNSAGATPFLRLAQVSQTTMLYDETIAVREILREAFAERFGTGDLSEHLLFHPTVCRATQDRQSAAASLCGDRCDLAVVVGGFGSSNTRHLYALASSYTAAVFIEGAKAIRSRTHIESLDYTGNPAVISNWLPQRRPLRIAVLAGASCPEIVIGQVLQRLAEFLT